MTLFTPFSIYSDSNGQVQNKRGIVLLIISLVPLASSHHHIRSSRVFVIFQQFPKSFMLRFRSGLKSFLTKISEKQSSKV